MTVSAAYEREGLIELHGHGDRIGRVDTVVADRNRRDRTEVIHVRAEDVLVGARVSRRECKVVTSQIHDGRGRGQRGVEYPVAVYVKPDVDLSESVGRVTEPSTPVALTDDGVRSPPANTKSARSMESAAPARRR